MDDLEDVPLIAAEVVGGALLVLVTVGALLLLYLFLRRSRLASSAPSMSCSLREQGKSRWRTAFIRMGTHDLDVFSVLALSMQPTWSWSRGLVEVSTPSEPTGFVPALSDPVSVVLAGAEGAVYELAIERVAYPALRSWTESGPPRPNSVV